MGCGFSSSVLDDEAVIIAVMGVTGSGKSSLIKRITQNPSVLVGDGLESVTDQIRPYYFTHQNVKYCLVDTPGFDDTYVGYDDITFRIIDWLAQNFRNGTRLNGIIYLHSIRTPRMSFSSSASLRMFRELCGDAGLNNVVLATTFWDVVADEVELARQRENELHGRFWAGMLQKGAKTARITQDRDACLALIEEMATGNTKMVLQVQTDVVDRGLSIRNTSAWWQALRESQGREAREAIDQDYEKETERSVRQHKKKKAKMDRRFLLEKRRLRTRLALAGG